MVVRAVSAVLTSEEQVMNPSLYPRQRRIRPGYSDFLMIDIDTPITVSIHSPFFLWGEFGFYIPFIIPMMWWCD